MRAVRGGGEGMSGQSFPVQRVTDKRSGKVVVCRSYKELDRVIKANAKATYAFALALYEMRESRAYKEKYGTFEDYCQQELGHTRKWANQLVAAQDFGTSPVPKSGLFSTGESEWPTPPHIVDAAVAALGEIDLDPCASAAGRVPARKCYTEQDDGLSPSVKWEGRVYMNPPYGRAITAWVERLTVEYMQGNVTAFVALVPARTDTAWFQYLVDCDLCLVRGRLQFGDSQAGAPFPSLAAYRGPEAQRFAASFIRYGSIWQAVAT